MSTNTEVVKRFVNEVVNQGRMATIAEVMHPRYRYHGPSGFEAEGHDGAESIVAEFRAAFSDLHAEITSEIAQGDLVALTMVMTGTHDGDLMGMAPTGAWIELPMAIVSRFEDGRIVEEWEYYDSATLMSQLAVDTTPDDQITRSTLVIGASGKTGRRVADRLAAATGVWNLEERKAS